MLVRSFHHIYLPININIISVYFITQWSQLLPHLQRRKDCC